MVSSTNDFAKDLIYCEISNFGIIISDLQSKGRGKYGNVWISKKGNIFCTIYKEIKNQNCIFQAQFSCLNIVKKYFVNLGINMSYIKIKKPNDILIKNKKICGILIESIKKNNKLFLIAGIGINLISNPKIKKYKTVFLNKFVRKKIQKIDFINYLKKNINKI